MAPDLTLGMLLPMGPRITLFQVVYIGLLHVAWLLSHFYLMCLPYPQHVVKGDLMGPCVTNCFYLMTLSFDQTWPTFLTNHICNTLLHVLKTFESIMPLRRHIPKRRPKMTCPLKHRSQPGIPRDLKQFYMYYLWEASHVANYLKLWALFAVPYSPSERTGRSPSSVVCCFSAFYIYIYILLFCQ